MTLEASKAVGLAVAAQYLRIPYQQAHRLLLMGKLRGEKRGNRWFVRATDVQRLARTLVRHRTRSNPDTAEALHAP